MDVQEMYESLLKGYQQIVFDDLAPKLALYHSLYKKYEENNEVFLDKAGIFAYVIQSLEVDTLLLMAKLLDGKRSDRNILKFIAFSDSNRLAINWKNGNIPAELITKHKELIAEKQAVINRITVRRDKFLAHSDKQYFLNRDKLDEDYPVSIDDLIGVVQCFQRILTDHSFGLMSGGRASYEGFFYIAVDNLLNKIMYPEHFKWPCSTPDKTP
jgi:hypothetical protein